VQIKLAKIADEILKEEPTNRPIAEPMLESQAPSDYKTDLFSYLSSMLK